MLKSYQELDFLKAGEVNSKKESFSCYMNSKLCSFLDRFGFEYEFYSSTECYKSGIFDKSLIKVMENYDEITKIGESVDFKFNFYKTERIPNTFLY